jgi:hypothetical protein
MSTTTHHRSRAKTTARQQAAQPRITPAIVAAAAAMLLALPEGASACARYLWETRGPNMDAKHRKAFHTAVCNGVRYGATGRRACKLGADDTCGDPFFFEAWNPGRPEHHDKRTGITTPASPPHHLRVWLECVTYPCGRRRKIILGWCPCECYRDNGHCCHVEFACDFCEAGMAANEPYDDNADHSEDAVKAFIARHWTVLEASEAGDVATVTTAAPASVLTAAVAGRADSRRREDWD